MIITLRDGSMIQRSFNDANMLRDDEMVGYKAYNVVMDGDDVRRMLMWAENSPDAFLNKLRQFSASFIDNRVFNDPETSTKEV